MMIVQCLCASTLFYCAHWQTYVSGTLTFGTIDVTEGQIVVMAVMLLSSFESFFSLDIWSSSVSNIIYLQYYTGCFFFLQFNLVSKIWYMVLRLLALEVVRFKQKHPVLSKCSRHLNIPVLMILIVSALFFLAKSTDNIIRGDLWTVFNV